MAVWPHTSPVEKEIIESLEIRISSGDLRSELFRLDQVLHMSEDQTFLLGGRLYGDAVQDEGVEAKVTWHDSTIYCTIAVSVWR